MLILTSAGCCLNGPKIIHTVERRNPNVQISALLDIHSSIPKQFGFWHSSENRMISFRFQTFGSSHSV